MFVTPAYAQSPDGGIFGGLGMIGPLVLIFVIMYFLVIRPQRQQMKKQQDMVNATRRGDTVVTAGGMVGKVTRVFEDSNELEVEIAEDVRVRVIRSTLSTVRTKGEVAKENTTKENVVSSKKAASSKRRVMAGKVSGSKATSRASKSQKNDEDEAIIVDEQNAEPVIEQGKAVETDK